MRTKILSLLAVTASLGFAQAASAADMPTKMPVKATPMAAPAYSWTGCYIGAQGAYKFGDTTPYNPAAGANWTNNFDFNGFVGGGTVGCNYQINAWVVGVEGDWGWGSVKGTTSDLLNPATFNTEINERSLGTIRGRVGYAWNNVLLFVTGGGAWSSVKFSFPCIAAGCQDFDATKTVSGYTIGAGLEYGFIGSWSHWSVKGEWLYVDFGTPQFIATNVVTGVATDPANVRLRQNLLRIGLNYRF
jgi:outer membrane immunogenic protein